MHRSSVLILAAGGSHRMGRPKQTLPFRGVPLIRHAVERALMTRAQEVIVVTGWAQEESLRALKGFPVRTIHNVEWQSGMGGSIRIGIRALSDTPASAMIMTCDQPLVSATSLDAMFHALESSPEFDAVAASYANILGVPVVFRRRLFQELSSLAGDEGARLVLKRHSSKSLSFDLPEAEFDVDTPEQYRDLALRGFSA